MPKLNRRENLDVIGHPYENRLVNKIPLIEAKDKDGDCRDQRKNEKRANCRQNKQIAV
jgi:hypothetical protein